MKVSRSDLKSIVKECLVEILSEGIGSTVVESKKAPPRPSPVVESRKRFDPNLDTPLAQVQRQKINTGNPIFDDILADTAKTTLPSMLQAESSKRPQATGTVERLVESSNPEDLFGDEAAGKWAQLAFSTGPRGS